MKKIANFILSMFLDVEWHPDPYKIAAFILIWQFVSVGQKVIELVDAKVDPTSIGIVAGLLVPITAMITFLFNFSKQSDATLLERPSKEQ